MNWRYLLGAGANRATHAVLSAQALPLLRAVPRGRHWMYDVQRLAGTRDLRIIFDVGANVGQTAWGLVRYFPRSSIFCVEPISETMNQLKADYGRYTNIRFLHCAFGSAPASMTIPLHKTSVLNTLVSDQPSVHDLSGEEETIQIDTLDGFCAREGIESIDLLKVDVQGWELEVLAGARSLLTERRIQFLHCEVCFDRADSDMQCFADLNDRMLAYGFRLAGFYDPMWRGQRKEILGHADALYMQQQAVQP